METYIKVGLTDFPASTVKGLSLEELQERYHYLPGNVIRELSRQVSPKVVNLKVEIIKFLIICIYIFNFINEDFKIN